MQSKGGIEDRGLDCRVYWQVLLRRWWILVLGVVGAAVIAFFLSSTATPLYQATAKVLVQGNRSPGLQSVSEIQASRQLARDYRDLIKTRSILEKVGRELELPGGAGAVAGKIRVNSPRSIIEIRATDPDPDLAAELANTTSQIFIEDFRNRQFTQISQFQASLSQYGIEDDSSIIAAQAATLSTLSIVEVAVPASSPFSPRTRVNMLLAVVVGLVISGLVVFVVEYLDDRVTSVEELKTLGMSVSGSNGLGVPALGAVVQSSSKHVRWPVITDERHNGHMAESYNFLQTNLEFATLGTSGLKTLLVTSSIPGEGKTTTAANLAVTMTRQGKSVVLVDSDLRRPSLHLIFGLKDQKGLTHLVLGKATLEEAMAKAKIEGLRVITSGPLPPDATHVLRAERMGEIIGELKNDSDLVIFDSPPLLTVSDALILVPLVDGVLLVVDARATSRNVVKRGLEVLGQINPPVVGTVLNKYSSKDPGYYYHYYHYGDRDERPRRGGLGRLMPTLFSNGVREFGPLSRVFRMRDGKQ